MSFSFPSNQPKSVPMQFAHAGESQRGRRLPVHLWSDCSLSVHSSHFFLCRLLCEKHFPLCSEEMFCCILIRRAQFAVVQHTSLFSAIRARLQCLQGTTAGTTCTLCPAGSYNNVAWSLPSACTPCADGLFSLLRPLHAFLVDSREIVAVSS